MRRVLLDDACNRGRLKRSGAKPPVLFLEEPPAPVENRLAVLAIAEALQNVGIVRRMGYREAPVSLCDEARGAME